MNLPATFETFLEQASKVDAKLILYTIKQSNNKMKK